MSTASNELCEINTISYNEEDNEIVFRSSKTEFNIELTSVTVPLDPSKHIVVMFNNEADTYVDAAFSYSFIGKGLYDRSVAFTIVNMLPSYNTMFFVKKHSITDDITVLGPTMIDDRIAFLFTNTKKISYVMQLYLKLRGSTV